MGLEVRLSVDAVQGADFNPFNPSIYLNALKQKGLVFYTHLSAINERAECVDSM